MSRIPKPIDISSKHYSKQEKEARKEAEKSILGELSNDKVKTPPKDMSKSQKKIYKFIISELENTGINATNLDIYMIETLVFAIDTMRKCQEIMNNSSIEESKIAINTYNKFFKIFKECSQELGLSITSRTKLAMLKAENDDKANDPLLRILNGEDFDDWE